MEVHFFLGAHQDQYKRLHKEIENNFPRDLNQWPKTLQEAYDLLQTYRHDPNLQIKLVKQGKGLIYITKKDNKAQNQKILR